MTHQELKDKYITCTLCSKCQNTRKVFGAGNLKAKIAVVGEGPGKDEVAISTPFCGAAGKLLNQILLGINLKREDTFVTNTVICRTDDKNRKPTKEESLNCRTRLFEELSIVKPRYTILAGIPAYDTIFGGTHAMKDIHGKWFTLLSEPCMFYYSIYHPAWILHGNATEGEEKAKKEIMWTDIKRFAYDIRALDESLKAEAVEV